MGRVTFPQYLGSFPKSKTGKVVINTNDTPNQIDLFPDEGPIAGQALQGIFELNHDVLKANFSFPNTVRP